MLTPTATAYRPRQVPDQHRPNDTSRGNFRRPLEHYINVSAGYTFIARGKYTRLDFAHTTGGCAHRGYHVFLAAPFCRDCCTAPRCRDEAWIHPHKKIMPPVPEFYLIQSRHSLESWVRSHVDRRV